MLPDACSFWRLIWLKTVGGKLEVKGRNVSGNFCRWPPTPVVVGGGLFWLLGSINRARFKGVVEEVLVSCWIWCWGLFKTSSPRGVFTPIRRGVLLRRGVFFLDENMAMRQLPDLNLMVVKIGPKSPRVSSKSLHVITCGWYIHSYMTCLYIVWNHGT